MAEIAGLEPHTSYAVRVRALTYQGKEGKQEKAFTIFVMPFDVFLDAFSHLYERACPSLRPSFTHELKLRKSAVFD